LYGYFLERKKKKLPKTNRRNKMNKDELLLAISTAEKQLANAIICTCEIYSRVVGYYRPVNQWNAGKRSEFKARKVYSIGV